MGSLPEKARLHHIRSDINPKRNNKTFHVGNYKTICGTCQMETTMKSVFSISCIAPLNVGVWSATTFVRIGAKLFLVWVDPGPLG